MRLVRLTVMKKDCQVSLEGLREGVKGYYYIRSSLSRFLSSFSIIASGRGQEERKGIKG